MQNNCEKCGNESHLGTECPRNWSGTKEEMKHMLETTDASTSDSFWFIYGNWIGKNMPELLREYKQ